MEGDWNATCQKGYLKLGVIEKDGVIDRHLRCVHKRTIKTIYLFAGIPNSAKGAGLRALPVL